MRCARLKRGCFVLFLTSTVMISIVPAQETNSELIKMIIELLNDKDKDLRSAGLDQIRTEAKGTIATMQFASQLSKLAPAAQVGLLSALGSRGDASAKPAILAHLQLSSDESVRVAAIGAVGELGDATDLPFMLKLICGEADALQIAAKKSLSRLRGPSVNSGIVAEIKNVPPTGRVALIEVLLMRRALDSMPQLIAAASDMNGTVRRAAMNALAEMGGVDQIPGMIQGVLKAEKGAERDAAERAVFAVCGRNSKPELRADPILAAMSKLDDVSQLNLLSTLARAGGAKALAAVEGAMASKNKAQHEAGMQAFCKWADASIADKLIALIENTSDARERSLEFKALVRIASLRGDKRNDADRLSRLKQAMSLAKSDDEKSLVIDKCRLAYSVESMRYVLPYVEQPQFAEVACETIVEIAHHREVREPHKAEFDQVLDRVMQISKDAVVKDRAQRYKNGQTWQRPQVARLSEP